MSARLLLTAHLLVAVGLCAGLASMLGRAG